MHSPIQGQIIALSGLMQALSLVKELARSGYVNSHDMETCIRSLFVTNPADTAEVYGGIRHLERGAQVLAKMLSGRIAQEDRDLVNYAVNVNNLSRKLRKNNKMLGTISKRLEEAKIKSQQFGISHDNTIGFIADTYTQTISTFSLRIQVKGEYTYLQQARVANQIRTLLLAAIRAAILWHQTDGSVWRFIFGRNKLEGAVKTLLEDIKQAQLSQ